MIKCPRCDGALAQAMTCSECHNSFGESAIIELYRHRVYCPDCGAENHNYSKFCHRCRTQMHSDEQLDTLYMLVLLRSLRERAHQAELAGQYDIARELYGYLKDYQKTEIDPHWTQHRHLPNISVDAAMLANQLTQKGVTLSYYCCYCGTLQTIGTTSPEIPNHCPQCGTKLDAIDFEKMIQNVLLI
jgi:hypothetical protein